MGKPIKSYPLRFAAQKTKLDLSVWEGREKEGKALPSSLSLRIQPDDTAQSPQSVYLNTEDALVLAVLLQKFSGEVLELDSQRRLEAWKSRQGQLMPAPA